MLAHGLLRVFCPTDMRLPKGLRRRLADLAAWERAEYPTPQTVAAAIFLLCDEWCITADSARANILGYYQDNLQSRRRPKP